MKVTMKALSVSVALAVFYFGTASLVASCSTEECHKAGCFQISGTVIHFESSNANCAFNYYSDGAGKKTSTGMNLRYVAYAGNTDPCDAAATDLQVVGCAGAHPDFEGASELPEFKCDYEEENNCS